MKTYDKVFLMLKDDPKTRNSDKYLIWKYWVEEGKATVDRYEGNTYLPGIIYHTDFMSATSPESIRRARQKIQETHPELRPTNPKVLARRFKKEQTKGTFIYRENVTESKFL